MDRLTDRRFASEGFYQPKSHEERLEIFANIPSLEAIYKRLAEYENTGLTPEQITAFKNIPKTDVRLISAQDIETSITERCTDCESNNCQDCIISEMQIKIWAAPTIEAQPVNRGYWINTNNPNHLRCSNCDIIHMIAQYPNGKISYCPNCGSYNGMDGDSE